MAILLKNSSRYSGKVGKTDWWDWTAYIECTTPDSLDDIDFVEYELHPSFRSPIQRVRRQEGGFPLTTRGWGVFNLIARVVFKDESRSPLMLEHLLRFELPPDQTTAPTRN